MTSDKLRQQFEGQLYKYTNVVKGWQYRWFILDPESGLLNYFLNDVEHKQRPRGFIHLAGAVVSPSDEDSNTFTVNSATGDLFKLRAADARSRQEWVNRMRAVAEMHTMAIAQSNPPLSPRESHSSAGATGAAAGGAGAVGMGATGVGHGLPSLAVLDAFTTVRQHIHRAEQSNFALARSIEELPAFGQGSRSIDPDLLVMKATSQATLLCLGQCLFILQQQQVGPAPLSQGQPAGQTLPATHQALTKKNSAPVSSQMAGKTDRDRGAEHAKKSDEDSDSIIGPSFDRSIDEMDLLLAEINVFRKRIVNMRAAMANDEMEPLLAEINVIRERIDNMQAVYEMCTTTIAQSNVQLNSQDSSTGAMGAGLSGPTGIGLDLPPPAVLNAITVIRLNIHRAEQNNLMFVRSINELPSFGPGVSSNDPGLLAMKATSQAALQCLGQCFSILIKESLGTMSDEDPNMITVHSTTSDTFTVQASSARKRQGCFKRMRAMFKNPFKAFARGKSKPSSQNSECNAGATGAEAEEVGTTEIGATSIDYDLPSQDMIEVITSVQHHINNAEQSSIAFARSIGEFPISGPGLTSTDPDLLTMKATSQAASQCLSFLQKEDVDATHFSQGQPVGKTLATIHQPPPKKNSSKASSLMGDETKQDHGAKECSDPLAVPLQPLAVPSSSPLHTREPNA